MPQKTPQKTAVIIGAGPAGLTAAYELLTRTDVRPVVLEASGALGGLSRTVNHNGNRIDIGGHRFFSKSDRVMRWWADMLPMQGTAGEGLHGDLGGGDLRLAYQGQQRVIPGGAAGPDPDECDEVMLVRNRKSRIFFLRKFFDYPISLSARTVANLGPVRMARILASYLKARLFPIRDERNLEEFFINRFGRELYLTFFKSYTEKVWGVPCERISAEWGAQRIKGLSITKAVGHAMRKCLRADRSLGQKGTETSLIERFLYPKFGPGQMWETCARKVEALGGEIVLNSPVQGILTNGDRVAGVVARDTATGEDVIYPGDYVFSTMPVQELIRAFDRPVPAAVREVADGLVYRDFITVGLLVDGLRIHDETPQGRKLLADNWVYVQEPDVKVGRLQLFNNWSPYMVADRSKVWLGMEYFCNEGDPLWRLSDEEMTRLAAEELRRLGFIGDAPGGNAQGDEARDGETRVLDATVIRVPKTYPAYFGSYDRFEEIRAFVDGFENLFLVGRNGMHRYNNQDHSMLTAMTAVDNILAGRTDKSNVWNVNTEQEYHEEAQDARRPDARRQPEPGQPQPAGEQGEREVAPQPTDAEPVAASV